MKDLAKDRSVSGLVDGDSRSQLNFSLHGCRYIGNKSTGSRCCLTLAHQLSARHRKAKD